MNPDKKTKLVALAKKAYTRLCFLRTRASDDEQNLNSGGKLKPRYRSVKIAFNRWKQLNKLAYHREDL
jgi:hypothetical protein